MGPEKKGDRDTDEVLAPAEQRQNIAASPSSPETHSEPAYPPETHRWMSWSANQFISRPTWRPLAWVCYGLFALIGAGFAASSFIGLTLRAEGHEEIVADPGVLEALPRTEGVLNSQRIWPGASVKKGEVLGMLEMGIPEPELVKMLARLERNVKLLEQLRRKEGLSPQTVTGRSLLKLNDDAVRKAATTLQISIDRLRKTLSISGPYERHRNEAIENSRFLKSVLSGYIENRRIRAPGPGKLLQFEVLIGGNAKTAEPVAILLPSGARLVARIMLEPRARANVEIGQRVNHKLEAYPYQRYGLFSGEVFSIEQAPQADGTLLYEVRATIRNPPELSERLSKSIRLVRGMKGSGEIITGEQALSDLAIDTLFGN